MFVRIVFISLTAVQAGLPHFIMKGQFINVNIFMEFKFFPLKQKEKCGVFITYDSILSDPLETKTELQVEPELKRLIVKGAIFSVFILNIFLWSI